MSSPGLAELVTMTLRNRSGKLSDNFTHNTALLTKLRDGKMVREVSGGRSIVEELTYAANGTVKRYSGYEPLNISPQDVFTAAEYGLKQLAVSVTISGLEELQNSGKEQIIDLLDSRISNAEESLLMTLSGDIYSDGTADGGKQVGGLQLLVSDTGQGTVGNIDSGTWSFWRNYVYSFATNSVTPGSTTIQSAMNQTWLNTQRNRDQVDLIIADNVYYRYYWESLQAIQRITTESQAAAGFKSLDFMGVPVVCDGGLNGDAPGSHMYFLNTRFLSYRPHKKRNMVPLNPDRYATNSDAMVKLIGWAGNMTARNRRLQGVIVN